MSEAIIYLEPDSTLSLQSQIRQKLIDAILKGAFPPGSRLPSSRKLAEQLQVARNTVVLAYEQLLGEGFIESRERSGIFVSGNVLDGRIGYDGAPSSLQEPGGNWRDRIRLRLDRRPGFQWPQDWQQHPFPFIEGHFDASLYPTAQWREASRLALGARLVQESTVTESGADDPMLLEQIRTKMLPRRGIVASPDQILITLGERNALYILSRLLMDADVRVAMEDPGSPVLRQLLQQTGARLMAQPVDECGMVINSRLQRAQVIHVTPSHQVPTAVTMPNERRQALLAQANQHDQLIIEDDYEHEHNYLGNPHPAVRSMDTENRVIYVSGLPKVLAPGLRIGFIVAAPELIREARRLRQMMVGRPSLINQRTAALFLSLGHYDSFMNRLHKTMGERWDALRQALNHYHRGHEINHPTVGGTALWVESPSHIDVNTLVAEAARRGILIEPDTHYYSGRGRSRNYFRMGVTSIPKDRIRDGVQQLEQLIQKLSGERLERLDSQDPGLLDGDALQQLLSGATIRYKTFYRDPCTIKLKSDGRMLGRAGYADEDRDEGRWWVEDDLYCRQWRHWSYGEPGAYRVTVHGDHIRWWRTSGELVDSAIIERSDAKLD